ncbi:unnamed protein product, partial [Scytosiphon promiscuus]
MKRAVRDFANSLSSAGEGSIAAVYYSGHGFQAGGRNYLAPIGADLRDEVDAEFEALAVDWVLSAVEKAHKGANIVILDACRNTALSRSAGTGGNGLALLQSTPRGSFISFATAPGSTAADGTGLNSPYTSAIAAELLVPGRSIEAVFKAVRRRVVTETGGEQVPWDHSSLTAEITFLPDASAIPSASGTAGTSTVQLELQLWNDVKDSGSRDQLRTYLDRYPEGAFATLAKARIEDAGAGVQGTDVERLFAQLASRSLIVENPTQPHGFYSNARLREIRGDYPGARQDYLKYFAFGMPQLD